MTAHKIVPDIGKKTDVPGVTILSSGVPGPRVSLMGMLHGNELCGLGLWQLANSFGRPLCGDIVLIVGHPKAVAFPGGPVRFIERDINRMFDDHQRAGRQRPGQDDERYFELLPILAQLDNLIDVHSTSSAMTPFVFITGTDPVAIRLAAALPVSHIYGLERFIKSTASAWFARQGGTAITIETGHHDDLEGSSIVFDLAHRLLYQLGMAEEPKHVNLNPSLRVQKHVKVVHHVKAVYPGFTYARLMVNFTPLEPGELISWDEEASYRAPGIDHAVMVMPASIDAIRGSISPDAFFIGIELDFLPNISTKSKLSSNQQRSGYAEATSIK